MDRLGVVFSDGEVRVVRFRRGVIVGLAALGSAALIGTAWLALKPASFSLIASGDNIEFYRHAIPVHRDAVDACAIPHINYIESCRKRDEPIRNGIACIEIP